MTTIKLVIKKPNYVAEVLVRVNIEAPNEDVARKMVQDAKNNIGGGSYMGRDYGNWEAFGVKVLSMQRKEVKKRG